MARADICYSQQFLCPPRLWHQTNPAATAFILASLAGVETPAVSVLGQADSIGVYRITNLPPGSYHVQAGTSTGPTSYYPGGAGLNDATIISVAADRTTVERIDFTIP